jgi:hypothetical protein
MAVKTAQYPVKFGNKQGSADARAAGVFQNVAREMGLAQAGVHREPTRDLELIFDVCGKKAAMRIRGRGKQIGTIRRLGIASELEQLVVLLREPIESGAQIVAIFYPSDGGLAAFVFGSVIFRGTAGYVEDAAFVVGAVVVVEGRKRRDYSGIERVDPRKCGVSIAFAVGVFQIVGWGNSFEIVGIVWIEGNLVIVAAELGDYAEVVL